ncbi:MAG: hypothetical protein C0434_02135 [Xanthomonadaceae bacterium]|nr:hypothetical protein [Xanthomonadaceae bacterium]
MSLPRLLFVGHGFHQKTGSSGFLLELLREHFAVTVVWDDSWKPGGAALNAATLNAHGADLILFFQSLPKRAVLRRLRCRRLFWAPMRDGIRLAPGPWRRLRPSGLRLISFCREAHDYCTAAGFESQALQYWPTPLDDAPAIVDEPLRLFFWMRRGTPGWPTLKALLGDARPERIVLRTVADPGETLALPSAAERAEYRIEQVPDWLEKADYLRLLGSCNTFMAPRLLEGIGLSFLDAMALGQAVIAPDRATMNEYFRDGENGWLYDPDAPQPLDFSKLRAIREQARRDVAAGRARWLAGLPGLISYLDDGRPNAASWSWRLSRLLLGH